MKAGSVWGEEEEHGRADTHCSGQDQDGPAPECICQPARGQLQGQHNEALGGGG
jgi:hypothetical protein